MAWRAASKRRLVGFELLVLRMVDTVAGSGIPGLEKPRQGFANFHFVRPLAAPPRFVLVDDLDEFKCRVQVCSKSVTAGCDRLGRMIT